jgi:transposase
MDISTLLADPVALRLEYIQPAPKLITLVVKAVQPSAECPRCRYASTRIHSRYTRTVADLPWHGITVRLLFIYALLPLPA